jgi:hypothetical protein
MPVQKVEASVKKCGERDGDAHMTVHNLLCYEVQSTGRERAELYANKL